MPTKRRVNEYVTAAEFREHVMRMDRRFEQVDRRFEQIIEELRAQRAELKAHGAELKAHGEELKVHGAQLRAHGEAVKAQGEELKAQRHWTEIVVGGFQRRAGRNLEDMVAGCLRVALDMSGIKKEALKLRQRLVDEKGEIGPPGRTYEIDLYAADGRSFVFEIKSYAEPEDVERFSDKAYLAAQKWGLKDPQKVFVTLEKGGEIQETCLRLGVTLA